MVRQVVLRVMGLVAVWWVLTSGEQGSWIVGIPTVLIAAVVSFRLLPIATWRRSLGGAARFIPYFVYWSASGGVDVTRRALDPRLPLTPGLLHYRLRVPAGTARVFLANVISLLPGTLSADLRGDMLVVHVLDTTLPILRRLERLESIVASLFSIAIDTQAAGKGP
jgi:multicomponent Na+:H+ antiporter subunit E